MVDARESFRYSVKKWANSNLKAKRRVSEMDGYMYCIRKFLAWVLVTAFLVCFVTACTVKNYTLGEQMPKSTEKGATESKNETQLEPLFDFYSVPADWPRVVPLMSEFKVTSYEWTGDEMYAAGYGDVIVSRANNFYTNAQKKHVSSNTWEQDSENPSVTEGVEQVFNYIGEGNKLTVVLTKIDEKSIFFELYFKAAD